MSPAIDGFAVSIEESYSGDGVIASGSGTIQRTGDEDTDTAGDFQWQAASKGLLNDGFVVPFASGQDEMSILPSVADAFVSGVWTGNVTIGAACQQIRIVVDDGEGHTGASEAFALAYPDSDGDGIADNIENDEMVCMAADNPDTDGDGLGDGEEDADQGEVVDFLPWGWTESDLQTFSPTINGFAVSLGDQFSGDACDGNTATFTPDRFLDYDTQCTATITTDVLDLAGNALPTAYQWSFATTDQIYSSQYTIFPTIAAYGVDGGENHGWVVDGVIDEIFQRTQYGEDVYVKRCESMDFTKYIDYRSFYEFALPARLSGDNAQIDSAVLHLDVSDSEGSCGCSYVDISGYAGDGVAEISDFELGDNLGEYHIGGSPEQLEVDLATFVASMIGSADQVGFILEPPSYTDDQHVGFWNGIPHPAYGYISGQIASLTISFTVLDSF